MKQTRIYISVLCLMLFISLAGCTNNSSKQNARSANSVVRNSKQKESGKTNMQTNNLEIKINGQILKAHLNNSSAAQAFAKKLPTTLTFVDFGNGAEKMADLHYSLSTKGMPSGDAGAKGTIGYWSPDRRIILYYGHVDYYPGIHIIGKFDSQNYAQVIKQMPDNTKVKINIAK